MKERNRLATERVERERLKPGYGQYEADERLRAVSDEAFGITCHLLLKYRV